ncbi:MMPL family transporter [Actinomadura rubrisoli]|uniref:MMPL family transporter n=1 Tax=Actinomadura rubrisoli TaxID=2530368 RepID=A0A4V2YUX1_9ACTN|nr:MMPL family transporter [Actinomadura rubrisoli]
MFARLARFVVRHPWWTIVAWLAAAVLIITLSPKLTTESDQGDFLPSKYESVQAIKIAEKAFPQQEDTSSLIVVKRSDGKPLTATDTAKVDRTANTLNAKKPPTVQNFAAGPETVAANKAVQVIMVPMKGTSQSESEKQGDAVKQIRKDLTPLLKGSGLEAKVGGDVAGFVDNEDSFNKSFEIVGIATFVLIIGLILLIFRAPIAAILPIVVIMVTMQVAMGLIGTASKIFGFSGDDSLNTIILIVLFGIGADYYLFLMFRFRERLRAGDDKKTAMITAVDRVGEVISSAAAAIAVTFLVLLLATFGVFSAWGPALAIAVIVMGITSLTLFPAIVSLLGTAVFWPSKAWKKQPKGTISAAIGRGVGKRPAMAALLAGIVMLGLAAGALGFKADYDFAAGFPQDTESAQATKEMEKGFPPGLTTPVQVFIKSNNGQPITQGQLSSFSQKAKSAPGVGKVQQAVPGQDKSVARVDLLLKSNPVSNDSITLVKDDLTPAVHKAAPQGTRAYVGGQTAVFADINTVNNRDLKVILPVAAILIALILALLLRSVVAPIYLVISVLVGFAATLGSAVYVFQGMQGETGVIFQLPIILYLFVLAIGTDYNILMTARLREEAKEGHEPRQAAALAVQHGGPTVAAAGLILAGTFSVMLLAPVSMLKQMGFSVAVGIALSAFVMSTFLVPGITAMLGHKAWWPGHGDEPKKTKGPDPMQDQYAQSGYRY